MSSSCLIYCDDYKGWHLCGVAQDYASLSRSMLRGVIVCEAQLAYDSEPITQPQFWKRETEREPSPYPGMIRKQRMLKDAGRCVLSVIIPCPRATSVCTFSQTSSVKAMSFSSCANGSVQLFVNLPLNCHCCASSHLLFVLVMLFS